jgi:hypothetical protein
LREKVRIRDKNKEKREERARNERQKYDAE